MHHTNTNETHGKKTRWELLKDAACCSEQILEARPFKIADVQPLNTILQIIQHMQGTTGEARTNS